MKWATRDVVRICGVTQRQIQWWDEKGIVKCELAGHQRLFTRESILRILLISHLRKGGITLHAIRKILQSSPSLQLAEVIVLFPAGHVASFSSATEAAEYILSLRRPISVRLVDIARLRFVVESSAKQQDRVSSGR